MATAPTRQNLIATSGVRNCDIARHVLSLLRQSSHDPRNTAGEDESSCPSSCQASSAHISNEPSKADNILAVDAKSVPCNCLPSVKVEETPIPDSRSDATNLPAKNGNPEYSDKSEDLARTGLNESQSYKQGQVIKLHCRDNYEFWVVPNIQTVHRDSLIKTICGILNSHRAGGVYFGVDNKGTVVGTPLSRKDRDEVRLGVDNFVSNHISPSLIPPTVDVRFVPVQADDLTKKCNNLFVVEIHLFPSPFDLYALNNGQCFIRKGKKHYEANFEDVYCLAISEGIRLFSGRANSSIAERKCIVCLGCSHKREV